MGVKEMLDKAIRNVDAGSAIVTKYVYKPNGNIETHKLGEMSEADYKQLIKGCKYDSMLEMWFTPKANIGYEIVKR